MEEPNGRAGTSRAPSLDANQLLAMGRLQLLEAMASVFEEVNRRVFGDTVRYRVLQLLIRSDGPLSLSRIAAELGLRNSSTKAYARRGRQQMGPVREAVERLAAEGIIEMRGGNETGRFECSLNLSSPLVQWILASRQLNNGGRSTADG